MLIVIIIIKLIVGYVAALLRIDVFVDSRKEISDLRFVLRIYP